MELRTVVLLEASAFFVIPLGVLIFSWLIQDQFHMRLNAGIEFFTFMMALDLTFLIWSDAGGLRINPQFSGVYSMLFGLLLLFSIIFVAVAAHVQSRINEMVQGKKRYYPFWRVTVCWLFALTGIGSHLYFILGGEN